MRTQKLVDLANLLRMAEGEYEDTIYLRKARAIIEGELAQRKLVKPSVVIDCKCDEVGKRCPLHDA